MPVTVFSRRESERAITCRVRWVKKVGWIMDKPIVIAVPVKRGDRPAIKAKVFSEATGERYDSGLVGFDVDIFEGSVPAAVEWMHAFDREYDRLAASDGRPVGRYPQFVAFVRDDLPFKQLTLWGQSGMRVALASAYPHAVHPVMAVASELVEDWCRANLSDRQ